MLIASGIGVTPYASILQSILYRHIASKVICPKCNAAFHSNQLQQSFNLKRVSSISLIEEALLPSRYKYLCIQFQVDFIWINRNQRCFEWFIKLMAQLEEQLTDFGSNEFLKIQVCYLFDELLWTWTFSEGYIFEVKFLILENSCRICPYNFVHVLKSQHTHSVHSNQ